MNKNAEPEATAETDEEGGLDFIRTIVAEDLASNKHGGRVTTRFPPEPNGYLHIGHAKSICLNFGLALENDNGVCNLRFDDTNPTKEDVKYVDAIKADIEWLGFEWSNLLFASDYFEQLYAYAEKMVREGTAYVDSQTEEQIRETRGTVTQPGAHSPYRERSVEENLDLLSRMRSGEFEDGAHVLRGKGDMAAPNMKMRDPLIYRIRHAHHYRTGDAWCIYPMYDYAHCLSDAIEGITHSLCTLEFENNRELYDWFLEKVGTPEPRPKQYEFAKLNLDQTIMGKRKLVQLVEGGHVSGWDDPRLPTIAALRRRGYTKEAIRGFIERLGIARRENLVELGQLEFSIRDDLNQKVPRAMAVLDPIKLVIENYPAGQSEEFEAANFPDDPPRMGHRKIPFGRELYIERKDFMEDAPKKYFRLTPGKEVRLRWAYLVTCTRCEKNDAGEVIEVRCTYDPDTRGGSPPDGRKVKGTIHWVSAQEAVDAEVRVYGPLVRELTEEEKASTDFLEWLNPESLEVLKSCKLERSLGEAKPGERFQFERTGYFVCDPDTTAGEPVFNRTVPLRDSWAKKQAKKQQKK